MIVLVLHILSPSHQQPWYSHINQAITSQNWTRTVPTDLWPVYTPVTQDGDLAAICQIGQIAADRRRVVVRSHRAPWQRCRSQWGPQGRRCRRQVLNMLKTSAVRSPRKQVAVASQQTRLKVAGGTPSAPWHRSDVSQGARSIAMGWLSGYALNLAKYPRYCLGTNKLKLWFLLSKDRIQTTTCDVYL